MKLSLFIATRIAFNKMQSFSRFIIRLSVAATGLSVMAMIVTLSFVNGFQKEVSHKVFSFWGHIHVQHFEMGKSLVTEETPITENDTILKLLQKEKAVHSIDAFATKSAVIEKNKSIEGILIKGVERNFDSTRFIPFMKQGHWLRFYDTLFNKELLVSEQIANTLEIKLGDTIRLHFISSKAGESSTYRKLIVSGIFKTGIEEYDNLFVIADIRLLQRLNSWQKNQIGGYEISLDDYTKLDSFNNTLLDKLPSEWASKTTKELYPNIFDWLNIQDVNRNVVFIIMTIVAIINLITCLLVLVLERTKMIGLLKAIGLADIKIQQIFFFNAAIITLIGIGSGLILGLGLCWLQISTHFIQLDESSYYVSYAPIYIIRWQVWLVCIGTSIICFLAVIIPTIVIKKLSPIKAIQFK